MQDYTIPFEKQRLPRDPESWWLVMEGDWGGQIYLTVPLSQIGLGADPGKLLAELDKKAWDCNDGAGASMRLYSPARFITMIEQAASKDLPVEECAELIEGAYCVSGGMGGGVCQKHLWLHDEFVSDLKWSERIRELLHLVS